jgi:hypothetical protein
LDTEKLLARRCLYTLGHHVKAIRFNFEQHVDNGRHKLQTDDTGWFVEP